MTGHKWIKVPIAEHQEQVLYRFGWVGRFWGKVNKLDNVSCWEWRTPTRTNGYGVMTISGKNHRAHRLSWLLAHGPIPPGEGYHGTCVLHRCDNPPCVNPAHLFLGTTGDNSRDTMAKGRNIFQLRPELIALGHEAATKISQAQVAEIKAARAEGKTNVSLARQYGIHVDTISRIINGRSHQNRGTAVSKLLAKRKTGGKR